MKLHYHATPKYDGTATVVRVEVDGAFIGKLEFPPGKWHTTKRWMELSAATMSITRVDAAGGVHLELSITDDPPPEPPSFLANLENPASR